MGPTPVFGVSGATMTGTTAVTSLVSLVPSMSCTSYALSWAGSTPVGTIIIQASNDYNQNFDGSVHNAGTWTTIPFANSSGTLVTSIAITGNTGQGMINLSGVGFYAIRIVYTNTSGTGIIFATVTGKSA